MLESHLDEDMARAIYESLPMFEAVNINKEYLENQAGSSDAFWVSKRRVLTEWNDAGMSGMVQPKIEAKLLNFLYLMDIRSPGWLNADRIHKFHDLAVHRSLEQRFLSKVNSDTTPAKADELLSAALEGAVQATKAYPGLTKAEEDIWNRVKVYHEFPDGFKWVYAVNADGSIAGYIPSRITSKTMHHCGNEPSKRAGNQYWGLRGPDGKEYLTVILNGEGAIEESKSWGNQPSRYRVQLLPYVKWFLKDRKVTGVGHRYDYGYATHCNFGVKDFIGDDPEFVDYVVENKPDLIGNTESRILFWQDALKAGVVTLDSLKEAFRESHGLSWIAQHNPGFEEYKESARFTLRDDSTCHRDSAFGANPFTVICAVCSGNPFTPDEIEYMAKSGKLSLEEFANYDIHLLDDDMQKRFVNAKPSNLNVLAHISNQVASFKVAPDLWRQLVPATPRLSDENVDKVVQLLSMIDDANPPSKVEKMVSEVFSGNTIPMAMKAMKGKIRWTSRATIYIRICSIVGKFEEMKLPPGLASAHAVMLNYLTGGDAREAGMDRSTHYTLIKGMQDIGAPRNKPLVDNYTPNLLNSIVLSPKHETMDYDDIRRLYLAMYDVWGDAVGRLIHDNIPSGDDDDNEPMRMAGIVTVPGLFTVNNILPVILKVFGIEGDHFDSMISYASTFARMIVDALSAFPRALLALKWNSSDTYARLGKLFDAFMQSDMKEMSHADGIREAVRIILSCVEKNPEAAVSEWGTSRIRYWYLGLGDVLLKVLSAYGMMSDSVGKIYRDMGCLSLEHDIVNMPGAWILFKIDEPEWEAMYEKYDYLFIQAYLCVAPTDVFIEDTAIGEFIYRKLLDADSHGRSTRLVAVLGNLAHSRTTLPKRSALGRIISNHIVTGDMVPGQSLFGHLYLMRMISAEAYRRYMERRPDRGAVNVNSYKSARSVLDRFRPTMKMDILPDLVEAAFRYCTDEVYEHLGDGNHMWAVDENAGDEATLIGSLASMLAMNYNKGFVSDAIIRLFTTGIVERLANFTKANRMACDDPEHPRSKIKCMAAPEIADAAEVLTSVKDDAEEFLLKRAARPKRAKRSAKN